MTLAVSSPTTQGAVADGDRITTGDGGARSVPTEREPARWSRPARGIVFAGVVVIPWTLIAVSVRAFLG